VAIGVGGLVLGLALLLLVVFLAIPKLTESGTVKLNLDSRTLALGHAEVKAQAIAEDGPLLIPDPAGGEHDIFVQHLGTDAKTGWTAFDARQPGTSRDCSLKWNKDRSLFVDPCDGVAVPADGGSLPHYKVDVAADLQLTLNLEQTASTAPPATPAP
jgi:hypothetical protein